MATREILQNGSTANDGTGDTLRDAAEKINDNFLALWEVLGSQESLTGYAQFDSDGNLVFSNPNTVHDTTLTVTDGTAARTITFPDATGTVSLLDNEETLSNKTLLHPVADDFHDSDDAIIFGLNGTPGAVNFIEVTNGDSDNPVELRVAGDAGDVDLKISAGGMGSVEVVGRIILGSETLTTDNSTANIEVATTVLNKGASPFNVLLPNGENVGDIKRFVNINTAKADITPNALAEGSTINIAQNGAAELIWSGTTWHLLGTLTSTDSA